MQRKTRIFALILALTLVLAALPVYAADSAVLMQASAKLKLLSEPKSGAKALVSINKNDAVLTLGKSGSYTLAQAGGQQGYVETRKLGKLSASANVKAIGIVGPDDAALYDAVDGVIKAMANKGSVFALTLEGVNWLALRHDGKTYFVKRQAVEVYNTASSASQFAIMKKSTSIYDGVGKNAKRLAKAAKGELICVLQSISDKAAIVKKGDSTAGIASLSSAELYPSETKGALTLNADAKLYRGAGTKHEKLGAVKKGVKLDKLGEYDDYTVVYVNGIAACVATKAVTTATPAAEAPQTEELINVSYGPIRTAHVEFIQGAYTYAAPNTKSEKYGAMPEGSVVRCYSVTNDGLWVNIQVDNLGNKGYAQRQYVKEKDLDEQETMHGPNDSVGEFIAITNSYRKAAGVNALAVSEPLMRAAAIRVEEITRRFSHTRPDGTACNTVDPANIFGENIAKGITMPTAQAAAKAFMSSPEHKENMLRANFTKTGAACLKIGETYYWVHLFG